MPASIANGSQTAVVTTEHTLATYTSGATVVLVVDAADMTYGDTTELRLYTKCRSGDTERLAYVRRFRHAQAEPIKYSVPVPSDVSVRATLKQSAGTGRAYPWSLLSV